MPLIRCSKCGQAYDVPGAVAVHLPNAIATCHCGEWLAGSKAAVLARLMNPDDIKEIDLQPYKVDQAQAAAAPAAPGPAPNLAPGEPRSVRITAKTHGAAIDKIFTIHQHPLWIGRQGSHIDLDEADLDLRHCSISLQGHHLILRDADSHMGTFLDGHRITETILEDGEHLVRIGAALITIEPTFEKGTLIAPVHTQKIAAINEAELEARLAERAKAAEAPKRSVLVCIDGPLKDQEFEIPPTGLVVGREGHVRVPDEYLSRKHFEVVPDSEGAIRVRDLGSRNGTFLNTLPASNTKVHAGDEIVAGTNRFRIEQRV